MKAATILLALALFLGLSASAFSSPSIPEQVKELEGKMAYLEALFVQTMGELQGALQDAQPVFKRAEAILKAKKDGFTCQEKVTINLAAYYEQYIGRLATLIKLIVLESTITAKEIERLKKQREA
jgi:hypothetical protein